MQCEEARDLFGAYRDDELSPEERRAVARHLEECRTCGTMLADDERIARSLRQLGRSPAPPHLSSRIVASIERIGATSPPSTGSESNSRPIARDLGGMARYAASLAAACVLSVLATWWLMTVARQDAVIERDVASAHIRSLMQDAQTQVASSDQHTVRPWFAGRADFAPDVKDLTPAGFSLIGGRLDYVADRRVVATVYTRRQHVISVFMWQSSTAAKAIGAPHLTMRNGYNVMGWSRDGITYWAVSDLNAEELREMQRLL